MRVLGARCMCSQNQQPADRMLAFPWLHLSLVRWWQGQVDMPRWSLWTTILTQPQAFLLEPFLWVHPSEGKPHL